MVSFDFHGKMEAYILSTLKQQGARQSSYATIFPFSLPIWTHYIVAVVDVKRDLSKCGDMSQTNYGMGFFTFCMLFSFTRDFTDSV